MGDKYDPLFDPGICIVKPPVVEHLESHDIPINLYCAPLFLRHIYGDAGKMPPEDVLVNIEAMIYGERIMSRYTIVGDEDVYVETLRDRSRTYMYFCRDY